MKNRKAIEHLTTKVVTTRKWQAACLAERERYEADPAAYTHRCGDDINWADLRSYIHVSLSCIQQGIYSDLCHNVETIGQADESALATLLGCPEDEPFEPFIDAYLKEAK